MAIESACVDAEVIDAEAFQDLAADASVTSVPRLRVVRAGSEPVTLVGSQRAANVLDAIGL